SRQADGRDRARRLHLGPGFPAMARHLARALGALPAVVQVVFLGLRACLRGAWLARLQAAGRHLSHPPASLHRILFCVLSGHSAVAWHFREDQAGAEINFGIGAGSEGVTRTNLSAFAIMAV